MSVAAEGSVMSPVSPVAGGHADAHEEDSKSGSAAVPPHMTNPKRRGSKRRIRPGGLAVNVGEAVLAQPLSSPVKPRTPTAKVRGTTAEPVRALLVVNVQNDHFADGSFPIPHAADVVPVINKLRNKAWSVVIFVKTEHPLNHSSFCSNNPGALLHEVTPFKVATGVGPQTMWPDYLVQSTKGAQLHPQLRVEPQDVVFTTGHNPHSDTYSAFGNLKEDNEGNQLGHMLKTSHIDELYVCGLASDYAVQFTVLDAKAVLPDVKICVVEDACKGVTSAGIQDAFRKFAMERVVILESHSDEIRHIPTYEPPLRRFLSAKELNSTSRHFTFDEDLDNLANAVGLSTTGSVMSLRRGSQRKLQSSLLSPQPAATGSVMGVVGPVEGEDDSDNDANPLLLQLEAGGGNDGHEESKAGVNHSTAVVVDQSDSEEEVPAEQTITPEELVLTVAVHDFTRVQELLQQHCPAWVLDTPLDPLGLNVLHMAAMVGDEAMVAQLITAGANPNSLSREGATPLIIAIREGKHAAARTLVDNPATSLTLADYTVGFTPLMVAASLADVSMVRLLLQAARNRKGVSMMELIEASTRFGMTPIMYVCAAFNRTNISTTRPWTPSESDRRTPNHGSASPALTERRGSGLVVAPRKRSGYGRSAGRSDIADRAALCLTLLVTSSFEPSTRVRWMRMQDVDGWSALHFAARTGFLAKINWGDFEHALQRVPVNLQTKNGLTMLQLATWNGQQASSAVLLGEWPDQSNPWRERVRVNGSLKVRQHSELDLAIMKNQLPCARLIVRAGGSCNLFAGSGCDKLMHKLMLIGDGIALELLLRNPLNKARVSKPLVMSLRRMKYPAACTFTFAAYHNPIVQHMFECTVCGQRVCLLCASICHEEHPWEHTLKHTHKLRYLGQVEAFCSCRKDRCQALAVVDMREAAGYKYVPNPIDTSQVVEKVKFFEAPGVSGGTPQNKKQYSALGRLANMLARNSHEVWAKERMEQGWRYGPVRDDKRKLHPSLFPYGLVLKENRHNDLKAAQQAILVVRAMGYRIVRNKYLDSRSRNGSITSLPVFSHSSDDAGAGADAAADSGTGEGEGSSRDVGEGSSTGDMGSSTGDAGEGSDAASTGDRPSSAGTSRSSGSKKKRLHLNPKAFAASDMPVMALVSPLRSARNGSFTRKGSINATSLRRDSLMRTLQEGEASPRNRRDSSSTTGSATRRKVTRRNANVARHWFDDDAMLTEDFTNLTTEQRLALIHSFKPRPVDTSKVVLRPELKGLVELLARNQHELWAESKMEDGYTYAPFRLQSKQQQQPAKPKRRRLSDLQQLAMSDDSDSDLSTVNTFLVDDEEEEEEEEVKCSPMLVPFQLLTEKEKAFSRQSAREMVKATLMLGYDFELEEGRAALNPQNLSKKISEQQLDSLQQKNEQLTHFKQGVYNAFLFAAATNAQLNLLDLLLKSPQRRHDASVINCLDEMGRTPVYLAVQHGHIKFARDLVHYGANLQLADLNGITPISIAAFQGNVEMLQMLIDNGAKFTLRDRIGLTPIHYAAHAGHLAAVELIGKKLTRPGRPGLNFEHEIASNDTPTGKLTAVVDALVQQMSNGKSSLGRVRPFASLLKRSDMDDYIMQLTAVASEFMLDVLTPADKELPYRKYSIGPQTHRRNSGDRRGSHSMMHKAATSNHKFEAYGMWHMGGSGRQRSSKNLTDSSSTPRARSRAASFGLERFNSRSPFIKARSGSPATPELVISMNRTSPEKASQKRTPVKVINTSPRPDAETPHSVKLDATESDESKGSADYQLRKRVGAALHRQMTRITPLTVAVQSRQYEVVELLLQLGADPNYVDGSGLSAYDRALSSHATAKQTLEELLSARQSTQQSRRSSTRMSQVVQAASPKAKRKSAAKPKKKVKLAGASPPKMKRSGGSSRWGVVRTTLHRGTDPVENKLKDGMAAKTERRKEAELEAAVTDVEGAGRMVDVLNESAKVQKRRRYFSFRTLANQLVVYLLTVLLLVMFTPVAWDHSTVTYARYRTHVMAEVTDSFEGSVNSVESWWAWVDHNVLWQESQGNFTTAQLLPCTLPGSLAALGGDPLLQPEIGSDFCLHNPTRVLRENLVVGGISITVLKRAIQSCQSPDFISNAPRRCLASDEDADYADVKEQWVLPSGSVYDRRNMSLAHRVGGPATPWMSRETRSVEIGFTLFNPNINVLVAVDLKAEHSSQGTIASSTTFASMATQSGRFPPSVLFAVAFTMLMLIHLASLVSEAQRQPLHKFITAGWTWVDFASMMLSGGVVAMDIAAVIWLDNLTLDMLDTQILVDVRPLFNMLLWVNDLVSIMILLLVARVIKYLRIFPFWGPMVVAVVMTWLDPSVLLYLAVTVILTAAVAIAFMVAFGAEVLEFSSLQDSFYTLFTMSFAEDWHEVPGATVRWLNTAFYLFYVVFAVVLLNLFIGIVTDVYPKARKKSQQEWENLITDFMQEEIMGRMNALQHNRKRCCVWCCGGRERDAAPKTHNTNKPQRGLRSKSQKHPAGSPPRVWEGTQSVQGIKKSNSLRGLQNAVVRQSSLRKLRQQHIAKHRRQRCSQWDWWIFSFRCCTCWVRMCNRGKVAPARGARKPRTRYFCTCKLRKWDDEHSHEDELSDDEEWDAGLPAFKAMEELVELMITTSVPDASGAAIDANVGKSVAREQDLYRTHLQLKAGAGGNRKLSVYGEDVLRRAGSIHRLASFSRPSFQWKRHGGEHGDSDTARRVSMLEESLAEIKSLLMKSLEMQGSGSSAGGRSRRGSVSVYGSFHGKQQLRGRRERRPHSNSVVSVVP